MPLRLFLLQGISRLNAAGQYEIASFDFNGNPLQAQCSNIHKLHLHHKLFHCRADKNSGALSCTWCLLSPNNSTSKQPPPYVDTEINRAAFWLVIGLNSFYISFVACMQFGVTVAGLVWRLVHQESGDPQSNGPSRHKPVLWAAGTGEVNKIGPRSSQERQTALQKQG